MSVNTDFLSNPEIAAEYKAFRLSIQEVMGATESSLGDISLPLCDTMRERFQSLYDRCWNAAKDNEDLAEAGRQLHLIALFQLKGLLERPNQEGLLLMMSSTLAGCYFLLDLCDSLKKQRDSAKSLPQGE